MGTISSGVGLISGLNIQDIVRQLIEIESRPIARLEQRVTDTQARQAAYTELSALLLGAKGLIHTFVLPSAFKVKTAGSSNESVLTATAKTSASAGTYSFLVKSLATSHQFVSSGFADPDKTPVGAGTLVFAPSQARVDPKTSISTLNGFNGIRRGIVRITDRSGASADVDLGAVTNVGDILDAINSQAGISVKAEVSGARIVLTDNTGLSSGNLIVSDLSGGGAAGDLGIAGTFASGQSLGKDMLWMTASTRLAALNDGLGVRSNGLLSDVRFELKGGEVFEATLSETLRFTMNLSALNAGRGVRADENGQRVIRITNRAGHTADIDLSSAQTLQDVTDAIASAGLSLNVSISGNKLVISDTSGGTARNLRIEDLEGYAAADLGIVADTAENGITGQEIYRVRTIGEVLLAIQYAEGNNGYLTAALSADGKGITITDNTTGLNDTLISAVNGSLAAYDLGLLDSRSAMERSFSGNTLTGSDLLGGLNTVMLKSLNGGGGVRTGLVDFTRANGETFSLDFTGAQTLADVIGIINADSRLRAEVGVSGTEIAIADTSGGTGTMSATGSLAEDLGLTGRDGQLVSGDLRRQYVSENTPLASLFNGKGIQYGQIRLSDSQGHSVTLALLQDVHRTVGDVLRDINRLSIGIEACINENGDGIKLVDTASGPLAMSVTNVSGGRTATDLGLTGPAKDGVIISSYGGKIEVDADDTLYDLMTKINDADIGVRAGLINDGSAWEPFRLALTSDTSGLAGRLAFHATPGMMKLDLLTEARDAVIVVGDLNSSNAIVMASGSNTVDNAIQGVTLNLAQTSDVPVTVSISNDVETVVAGIKGFVEAFNLFVDKVAALTKYEVETGTRGLLLGDGTTMQIRDSIYRVLLGSVNDKSLKYTNVTQVGLTLMAQSGGKLQFNEEKFRSAFEEDPDAVNQLFTRVVKDENGKSVQVGIAGQLDNLLSRLTSSVDGTLSLRNKTLQDEIDQYVKRQAELQERINAKEAQLYARFYAMETALASLQSQQSALTSLAAMVNSTS